MGPDQRPDWADVAADSALMAVGLTAELPIVGRPPHGLIGRLGSATHGVLHRAGCPVAVVPVPNGTGASS